MGYKFMHLLFVHSEIKLYCRVRVTVTVQAICQTNYLVKFSEDVWA